MVLIFTPIFLKKINKYNVFFFVLLVLLLYFILLYFFLNQTIKGNLWGIFAAVWVKLTPAALNLHVRDERADYGHLF